jgi:hypothetical protein
MKTISPVNNKRRIIIFLFAVLCTITPFVIGLHSNDDYSSIFDSSLFIDDDDLLFDSHSSCIIENNVSFVFCLACTFFIQPEETFHQALSIFPIFLSRASPLSLPT